MHAPAPATHPADIGDLWRWLAAVSGEERSSDRLFARFCAELGRLGLPVWRGVLGLEILHPEISGTLVVWTADDVEVRRATRSMLRVSDEYQRSPTRVVDETDAPFRRKLDAPCPDMPLLEELRQLGATDYVLHPLPFLNRSRTATMGFTTRRPGGFTPEEDAALADAMRLFSPYAEREVLSRIAVDLLDTYVGPRTGRRIIEGGIDRGDYDVIEAAIWHADLRGFTRLSETRPTAEVIERLNAWLEPMVAAIQEHDGEVLKFIGDAVPAIFPTSPRRSPARACRTERKIAGKAARSARSRPLSLRKVAWAGADTP